MSYYRVIPRDLFNEANLLKCIGKLTLLMLDKGIDGLQYEHDGEAFNIEQDSTDGSIYISNINFYYEHEPIFFRVRMNDKRPWPLVVGDLQEYVFDEEGNFNNPVLYETCEQS